MRDYKRELVKNIVPFVLNKLVNAGISTEVVTDLTSYYVEDAHMSSKTAIKLNDINTLLEKGEITDTEGNLLILFTLASIYYLSINDAIEYKQLRIEGERELGYKGSLDAFITASKMLGIIDKNLSSSDISSIIQQKLHVKIGQCTVQEYFEKQVYLADLDIVSQIIDFENDENIKEFLDFISNSLNTVVKKVYLTYTSQFESAYQVLKPVGVLAKAGLLKLEGNSLVSDANYEIFGIYRYLINTLGYEESLSREFPVSEIVERYERGNKKVLYCPNKMIEFVFGCSTSSNGADNVYTPSSDISSWNEYWNKQVLSQIRSICRTVLYTYFKRKGYLENNAYKDIDNFQECKDVLDSITDYLYRNLTACIIVSSWRKVDGNFIGFKFRCTDIDHVIPLDTSVTKMLVANNFGGLVGDNDSVYEPVVSLGSRSDYSVISIQHKFNPAIVNGEPLFSYRALEAMKAAGKSVSWESLILGKREDDSILAVGDEIKFKGGVLCHWINAGSRAGKGVMTLNILAGAIASGKPIFYLDNKPDMASMFRSAMLSGGNMFCINGDYDVTFDTTFNSCNPEMFGWSNRVPSYVKERMGDQYTSYASLYYLRAVMFMMCVIYLRGMLKGTEQFEEVGGSKGVVVVIDEITAASRDIANMLSKNGAIGSAFYSTNTISKLRDTISKGKQATVDQFTCYCTDMINSLNSTMRTLSGWQQKGLAGGGREGDISDVFILGQLFNSVDKEKLTYIPTNDNNMNGTCGNPFYNFLFAFGENDAFMGYNAGAPEYMYTSDETSKSYTRLNATARNFAYIKNFTVGTLDTMRNQSNGGVSSKDLSESALYFKPFLIFNDGAENGPYVDGDMRKMCAGAGLDFEQIKNENRRNRVLAPEIGFIPYVEAQGGVDVKDVLRQSFDIGNFIVQSYIPGYEGTCIDFIYDLSPRAMFTAESLLTSIQNGSHKPVTALLDEFFNGSTEVSGLGDEGDFSDFNDIERFARFDEEEEPEGETVEEEVVEEVDEPSGVAPTDMYSGFEDEEYEEESEEEYMEEPEGYEEEQEEYSEATDEPMDVWTHEERIAVAKFLAKSVIRSMMLEDESELFEVLVNNAYTELQERGY